MLLHAEMCDEKVANNGEVFIDVSGPRKVISFDPWYYDSLEDQKYGKIIPWEVDQVKVKILHILPVS